MAALSSETVSTEKVKGVSNPVTEIMFKVWLMVNYDSAEGGEGEKGKGKTAAICFELGRGSAGAGVYGVGYLRLFRLLQGGDGLRRGRSRTKTGKMPLSCRPFVCHESVVEEMSFISFIFARNDTPRRKRHRIAYENIHTQYDAAGFEQRLLLKELNSMATFQQPHSILNLHFLFS